MYIFRISLSCSQVILILSDSNSSLEDSFLHMTEIDGLTSKIKSVVSQLVSREEEVVELKELLEEKESQLRS